MTLTTTPDGPKNNPENKKTSADLPVQQHGQAEIPVNIPGSYSMIERQIKDNIDYEYIAQGQDREFVDSIVQIMLDVFLTEDPKTVKIGKETKNREIVKNVYLKLTGDHITHVISQYKDQYHRITHKAAYLRTMLYTCYQELDAHYTNAVRADGIVR